jgi:hypothetical protein
MKEPLSHSLQAVLSVPISIAKDRSLLLQRVVDTSEALVRWGRTLVVACFVDHIGRLVGIDCNKRKDFGSWDRILLVDVYLEATIYC